MWWLRRSTRAEDEESQSEESYQLVEHEDAASTSSASSASSTSSTMAVGQGSDQCTALSHVTPERSLHRRHILVRKWVHGGHVFGHISKHLARVAVRPRAESLVVLDAPVAAIFGLLPRFELGEGVKINALGTPRGSDNGRVEDFDKTRRLQPLRVKAGECINDKPL